MGNGGAGSNDVRKEEVMGYIKRSRAQGINGDRTRVSPLELSMAAFLICVVNETPFAIWKEKCRLREYIQLILREDSQLAVGMLGLLWLQSLAM